MPSRTGKVVKPARRGVVRDLAPSELHAEAVVQMRDMCFIDGILTQAGGWAWLHSENPLAGDGSSPASVTRVTFDGGTTILTAISDANGRFWATDGTSSGQLSAPSADNFHSAVGHRRREFVGREAIWCPIDGKASIQRWAGTWGADSGASAGTFTYEPGEYVVVGSGTDFAAADEGRYIGAGSSGGLIYTPTGRIVSHESATQVSVASTTVLNATTSSLDFERRDLGVCGLMVEVCSEGDASSSGTAVTGRGTAWNSAGDRGRGQPRVGDLIAPASGTRGKNDVRRVTAIGSDTSITIDSAFGSGDLASGSAYRILRPMVGREARLHRGRVYFTGCEWWPDRIWYSRPVGTVDLGEQGNDINSLDTEIDLALIASNVDLPARAGGRIIALTSVSDGLLVHREQSLWMLAGDPDLNLSAYEIGNVGTIDQRSVVEYEGQVYFASHDGVYVYSGGGYKNLLDERRMDEWHRLGVRQGICAAAHDHLIVVAKSGSYDPRKEAPWVYDIARDVWSGDWYFNRPPIDYMDSESIPGAEQEIVTIGAGNGGLGQYDGTSRYQAATVADRFLSNGVRTHLGAALVRFPPTIANVPGLDVKRVLRAKVYYTLDRPAGAPRFEINAYGPAGQGRSIASSQQESADYAPADTTTGLSFTLSFPLSFGAASSPVLSVTNAGTLDTPFVGTIDGPMTDPYILNETSGDRVDFPGVTVASGTQMVVNTGALSALNNGTDVASFAVVTGAGWPKLRVGSNVLRGTGSAMLAGTTHFTVTWSPLYGG